MDLVVIGAMGFYLIVLILLTCLTYQWVAKRGSPRGKRRLIATVGFLVVFLVMFWDWLPTVWLHSYYCDKYAGLTVYKTLEQWKQENPGIAETMVRQKPPLLVGTGDKHYFQLNQRFRWEIEYTEKVLWLGHYENRVVDSKTGEVLARYIDFSTGQSGHNLGSFRDFKPWMYRQSCAPLGRSVDGDRFGEIRIAYETLGGK